MKDTKNIVLLLSVLVVIVIASEYWTFLKAYDFNQAEFEEMNAHQHSKMCYISIPMETFNDYEPWLKNPLQLQSDH